MRQKKNFKVFIPVHKGILDLCTSLPKENFSFKNKKIGIDTETGYARALLAYLEQSGVYPNEYQLIYAGATNIRYEKLIAHKLDLSLLNPPYSYLLAKKTGRCINSICNIFGNYLGICGCYYVLKKNELAHREKLTKFVTAYKDILSLFKDPSIIAQYLLQNHPELDAKIATKIVLRLKSSDGLCFDFQFAEKDMQIVEHLFSTATKIKLPKNRPWLDPL